MNQYQTHNNNLFINTNPNTLLISSNNNNNNISPSKRGSIQQVSSNNIGTMQSQGGHHQMTFFLDQRISQPIANNQNGNIGKINNNNNRITYHQQYTLQNQNKHNFNIQHHHQHSNSLNHNTIPYHQNNQNMHHIAKIQLPTSNKNIPSSQTNINIQDKMVQIKKIQHFSYATSDQIGLGFSSRVYKGKNDKTNQFVAIKVIDLKKNQEDKLQQQFLNDQVIVLQKVKNANPQNLLKLQGVFKTKNNLYIVSQFCQGKDMGKILRKKKQLSQQQAQSVMKQLLNGYQEIFNLKLVHRDLKLANIFVKKGKIKIADFGFAIDVNKCDQNFTYNVGSPYYMPPQSLKFNRYSYKSDVWALGVIAYQLVHGKAPWKDKNDAILFQKIASTPIQSIIDPQLKLSQNYINFIRRCLTLDYQRRANPNLIISWPWNLAKDKVQGIQEKKKHMLHHAHSLGQDFVGNQQDIFMRKPTVVTSHVNMQQHKLNSIKAMINADKKSSQNTKGQGSPFWVQQTVLAQLHYCRFLSNLYEEMQKDRENSGNINNNINSMGMKPPGLVKHRSQMSGNQLGFQQQQSETENIGHIMDTLKKSIAQRIISKIQLLLQIVRTGQNILKIPGFPEYTQTPGWQKLKGVIKQYQIKYYQQYKNIINFSKISPTTHQQIQSLLVQTISKLKGTLNNHTKNLRLLQLLTFYYQILGLEKQNNPSSFAKVAKMDLVNSKKEYQSLAIQRLMKKLQYMGL